MFVAKLTVEISGTDYDVVQKKMKAFKALARRHNSTLVVDSFGGDKTPDVSVPMEAQNEQTV